MLAYNIFSIFANMNKSLIILLISLIVVSCKHNEDNKASLMLDQINHFYEKGQYKRALDSIVSLRKNYPQEIEIRKKALVLWQKASLKQAEEELYSVETNLKSVSMKMQREQTLLEKNKLKFKYDSLKGRLDAMCGVIRMIKYRIKENEKAPNK